MPQTFVFMGSPPSCSWSLSITHKWFTYTVCFLLLCNRAVKSKIRYFNNSIFNHSDYPIRGWQRVESFRFLKELIKSLLYSLFCETLLLGLVVSTCHYLLWSQGWCLSELGLYLWLYCTLDLESPCAKHVETGTHMTFYPILVIALYFVFERMLWKINYNLK